MSFWPPLHEIEAKGVLFSTSNKLGPSIAALIFREWIDIQRRVREEDFPAHKWPSATAKTDYLLGSCND